MKGNGNRENSGDVNVPSPCRTPGAAIIPLLFFCILSACSHNLPPPASSLAPFSSDGCSLFPDGSFYDQTTWCDCCEEHDLAYWQGGSDDDRQQADIALRDCLLQQTANTSLAEAVYLGVRAGGHPAFPTWYRWGYGWSYGRGYQILSDAERLRVAVEIRTYPQRNHKGYCGEETKVP